MKTARALFMRSSSIRMAPKLKESESSNFSRAHAGQTTFRSGGSISGIKGSMTVASLAGYLSGRGYGPVQDFTGLKGRYDIDLSWAPDRTFEPMGNFARATEAAHPYSDVSARPAADLFDAIKESLGLKLERRTEPVQILVVDHVERMPTSN
jgi:uncharacterized protein (TIGR03435 family)